RCSQGAGNGLLLPYLMRFNLSARPTELAPVARLLGEDIGGHSERAAAQRAVSTVEKMRQDIGIPLRLRDLGVKPEQLCAFAEKAFGIKRILRVNPRAVTVEDLETILKEAY